MWADGNATVEARPWTSGKTTAPVWQSRGRRIRWQVIWAFFGSICIGWQVIWAFLGSIFRSLLLLIGWDTNGCLRRKILKLRLQVRRVSGKASNPALFLLYLWNVHDRVKWDEKKYAQKHPLKIFEHSDIYLKYFSAGFGPRKEFTAESVKKYPKLQM